MEVNINFLRPNERVSIFKEGFVNETESRLKTHSLIPYEIGAGFSKKWNRKGLIADDQEIIDIIKEQGRQNWWIYKPGKPHPGNWKGNSGPGNQPGWIWFWKRILHN